MPPKLQPGQQKAANGVAVSAGCYGLIMVGARDLRRGYAWVRKEGDALNVWRLGLPRADVSLRCSHPVWRHEAERALWYGCGAVFSAALLGRIPHSGEEGVEGSREGRSRRLVCRDGCGHHGRIRDVCPALRADDVQEEVSQQEFEL
eukprot:CAMPEP_0115527460 /NCGR_PEP_ID=MMETSP0271-20121206/82857_1 /TAXON_ID=71861 /ORGANISM="Scrippsiella trochoidea, Strain CCMP3099" /LENGTH=146 /DNA_ID=CAMNT_0002959291 /DNA_START=28 /DNA_END=465 /DNA_ORIENTATION=-